MSATSVSRCPRFAPAEPDLPRHHLLAGTDAGDDVPLARHKVKSIGLVSNPIAPPSIAFRLVSGSQVGGGHDDGTSGRIALNFGSISRPLMPGMLMFGKDQYPSLLDRLCDPRESVGR
jgi:hypothetical protein